VALKYLDFFLASSQYLATALGGPGGLSLKGEEKVGVMEVTLDAYERLQAVGELGAGGGIGGIKDEDFYVQRSAYRNAGVIAGMLGQTLEQQGREEEGKLVAVKMFQFWERFIEACEVEDDGFPASRALQQTGKGGGHGKDKDKTKAKGKGKGKMAHGGTKKTLTAATPKQDCREISLFLDHAVNPYSGQKFAGLAGFEFLDRYNGLLQKEFPN